MHKRFKDYISSKQYKNSVRTSQETHDVTATKPNRVMLFRERVAVYWENHTEHTDTLCGQNAIYINSVRTSQKTYDVTATKSIRLMLLFTAALASNSPPFHTNLLVFSSSPDYQLTKL
jgi:hypothetical protein